MIYVAAKPTQVEVLRDFGLGHLQPDDSPEAKHLMSLCILHEILEITYSTGSGIGSMTSGGIEFSWNDYDYTIDFTTKRAPGTDFRAPGEQAALSDAARDLLALVPEVERTVIKMDGTQ